MCEFVRMCNVCVFQDVSYLKTHALTDINQFFNIEVLVNQVLKLYVYIYYKRLTFFKGLSKHLLIC